MPAAFLANVLGPHSQILLLLLHERGTYLFDRDDRDDWIARHFFTGGVMPSHHLIRQYRDLLSIEKAWRWSGTHCRHTAMDWLANFNAHAGTIESVLHPVYGNGTQLRMRR